MQRSWKNGSKCVKCKTKRVRKHSYFFLKTNWNENSVISHQKEKPNVFNYNSSKLKSKKKIHSKAILNQHTYLYSNKTSFWKSAEEACSSSYRGKKEKENWRLSVTAASLVLLAFQESHQISYLNL